MLLDDWTKVDMRTQEPNCYFRVESEGEEITTDDEVSKSAAR